MLFKNLPIGETFTCPELAEGTLRKISAKKWCPADEDNSGTVIASINTEVGPAPKSRDEIIADAGMKPEAFDPTKLIAQLRARSWRNYDVVETLEGAIEPTTTKLAALLGNETFMAENVTWDADGKPVFAEGVQIVLPEGVAEADYTGFMEAAIPDLYKRRVTLYRAQGLSGTDLYYALVAANRGEMTRPGKGVDRTAHLRIVKANTRKNNRSRSRDRVFNLQRAA